MKLIARLLITFMLGLGIVTPHASRVAAAQPKPKAKLNVLFIAVDDLRPEFGAYGSKYIHSPNLDRLAKQGVTFTRAYVQQAVCSPSRTSFFTGARPDTTKVWDLVTHFRTALPDVVTLPQHFKNNGYFVQGMGKIYHGGYDDAPSWSVPWGTPKAVQYGLPENEARQKASRNQEGQGIRGPAFEGADVPDNTFQDGKVAELAVQTLGEMAKKNQPFWLGVGFIKPHLPFVAPKKYWDLYDPAKIQLAPNPFRAKDAPEYAVQPGGELRNYKDIPQGPIPDELARQLKHGYYAAISYMDAQLGKALDELDRLKLRDNTIIVLVGDHGWKLGEHGAWCKHTNVENDTHAPLLISVPGMKNAGSSNAALVEFVDIYPTLAELCGLSLPKHLEGTSLVPLLNNKAKAVKTAAFSQYHRVNKGQRLMGYTMRTERYRFTRWVHRDDHSKVDAVELYDEQTDPRENVNIANDPKNAALVAKLTEQWLKSWQGASLK
jgi:choline-sulfatase